MVLALGIGTFLSALLLMWRHGRKLGAQDFGTLFINLLFGVGIVVVIGIVFGIKQKK